MHYIRKGFLHSTLLLALVGVGCKVEVGGDEKQEPAAGGDGSTQVEENGGTAASTGGKSGGAGNSAGAATDSSSAAGAEAGGAGGAGGAAGQGGSTASLAEDCDTDMPGANDDTEHAVALGSGATLCVQVEDRDFFYIDTPNDKKAHIARVLINPDPDVSVEFEALAGSDGSTLGSDFTTNGADMNLALVLAPGTRTYLNFGLFSGGSGLVKLTSTLEAEQDIYEPNNERGQAADIRVNTDVVAQFHAAYASRTEQSAVDWYQAKLTAGPHKLHIAHLPDDIALDISGRNPKGGSIGHDYRSTPGELFDFEFDAETDGVYQFALDFFSPPSSFIVGKPPASLTDTYTFSIVE